MKPKDLTAPDYAASIWAEGDDIHMTLPPTFGEESGHTVIFPPKEKRWEIINSILRAREIAARQTRGIGFKAAPVQYDIEQMLKVVQKSPNPRIAKAKAADDLSLDDLNIDELMTEFK